MTRLGRPRPPEVDKIRKAVTACCKKIGYGVIDANSSITGRDFLIKIWKLIAATPLSVGIFHEDVPLKTQANIFYELGVAQALGKETVIIKSKGAEIPSDFARSEYITFDKTFNHEFNKFLKGLDAQAEHYETMADVLEKDPILALNYLKRVYLITGDKRLKAEAKRILKAAEVDSRAKNSVEQLAAAF